jgi:Family of unknown function (DUF6328)
MHVAEDLIESPGRNETALERCDRNLVELLQEVRVVQTGVQVLFAFLLMAPLTPRFPELGTVRHAEYFAALSLSGLSAVLLMAPTAYHRVLFRRGDKEYLVALSNRFAIAGLATVGLAMVLAFTFVVDILFGRLEAITTGGVAAGVCLLLWAVGPLSRRRRLRSVSRAGDDDAAQAASTRSQRNAERVTLPSAPWR